MLNVIVSAHELERTLVPTLVALVPGVSAGLLGEVVVADAGSRDATAEVADIAGCRFVSSGEPLGTRLKAAAVSTRAPWLMFLIAGTVPEPGWVGAVSSFIETADMTDGAAPRRSVPPADRGRAAPGPGRGAGSIARLLRRAEA